MPRYNHVDAWTVPGLNKRLQEIQEAFTPAEAVNEITLSSGQLTVDLSGVDVSSDSRFFVYSDNADSGALPRSQYTVVDEDTIELTQSYPAGTKLFW